jgi:hypothetical protein
MVAVEAGTQTPPVQQARGVAAEHPSQAARGALRLQGVEEPLLPEGQAKSVTINSSKPTDKAVRTECKPTDVHCPPSQRNTHQCLVPP